MSEGAEPRGSELSRNKSEWKRDRTRRSGTASAFSTREARAPLDCEPAAGHLQTTSWATWTKDKQTWHNDQIPFLLELLVISVISQRGSLAESKWCFAKVVLRCHYTRGSITAPTSWLDSTWMSAGKGIERREEVEGGSWQRWGEKRNRGRGGAFPWWKVTVRVEGGVITLKRPSAVHVSHILTHVRRFMSSVCKH